MNAHFNQRLALGIVVLICLLTTSSCTSRSGISSNHVTAANIRRISLDMPIEEVISILGPALKFELGYPSHNNSCTKRQHYGGTFSTAAALRHYVTAIERDSAFCCDAVKSFFRNNKKVSLEFTEAVDGYAYPMLWIHLNRNFRVRCVFAKRYLLFGGDDFVTYSLHGNLDLPDSLQPRTANWYGDIAALSSDFW